MEIIKRITPKRVIIILITLVVIISIYLFIDYKVNFLKRTVFNQQSKWDITLTQNSKMIGHFMGEIYNQNYNLNNLPPDLTSAIISNYYVLNSSDLFSNENKKNEGYFNKTISKDEMNKFIKKSFGESINLNLQNVSHECGGLRINNNSYTISTYEPEACGIFALDEDYYISDITNYYKEDDDIIVEKKVAYVYPNVISEEDGEVRYEVYEDKTKSKLINESYYSECLFEEKREDYCYENFRTYKITLKRGKNNHYYFYQIERK